MATGEFADVWGAFPGADDMFHLFGKVTTGSVAADGAVTLEGTLTEYDYNRGTGKIFEELNVPFMIVTGGSIGENVFSFQFCELPTFYITGKLSVH